MHLTFIFCKGKTLHVRSQIFFLQVNEVLMAGVSHTKAVTTIRKAKGVVHLFVSRPPDQNPNTYLAYLPINSDTCNGNAGIHLN